MNQPTRVAIAGVGLVLTVGLAACGGDKASAFQTNWTDQPISSRDTVCEALSASTVVGSLGFAPMRESEAALYVNKGRLVEWLLEAGGDSREQATDFVQWVIDEDRCEFVESDQSDGIFGDGRPLYEARAKS